MTLEEADDRDGFAPALTSLVGRDDEIDRLTRLLDSHRLVTVIGPGGIGKTRLAAATTGVIAATSGTRVRVAELAAVEDAGQVPKLITAKLRCRPRPGWSNVQSIAALMASEPTLLVLDNCEHVVEAVAELCTDLLTFSDEARILATSREPIGVASEIQLRLGPLSADSPPTAGHLADGVRLFAERAQLVDPGFRLTTDTAEMVAQIVTRLDGLPLAIELAAARFESLGLTGLLQLEQPSTVLTSRMRGRPSRHRSLQATVEWSYRLLSPAQQRVLRHLSALPGPFTLEAAEAIAGSDALAVTPTLVDSSLLNPPTTTPDGDPRYLMLGAVREFARQRLTADEAETDVMAAMATYAAAVAQRAADGIGSASREAAAARRCDLEDPLMRQALSWAGDHDHAVALDLALALAPWWQLRGRAGEGYQVLLDAATLQSDRGERWVSAQVWLGRLAHSGADWTAALKHFDRVCEALGAPPPTPALVDALTGRSGTLRNMGRLAEATGEAERALEMASGLDYAEGRAQALVQLTLAASYAGDHRVATERADQAALVPAEELPDRVNRRVAVALTVAQTDAGALERARRTCSEGLASARRSGDVDMQADFLYFTTHIALLAADFAGAAAPIHESLQHTMRSGDRLRLLDCLDDCARLCAGTARPVEAVTLWAARRTQAKVADMPKLVVDTRRREQPLREARAQLGPEATEAAERRGARMGLAAAAELAALVVEAGTPPTDQAPAVRPVLTPREQELVTLVAGGRTDAQIAAELFISIRTVRSHLDRIRDKTGSRRRADLTRLALESGLI